MDLNDLDTAQRISLIQRNLEMAQVSIDSAVELLRMVINGASITHQPVAYAPSQGMLAPIVANGNGKPKAKPRRKSTAQSAADSEAKSKVTVPVVLRQRPDGKQDNLTLLSAFVAHHTGQFGSHDVLKWVEEHGYAIDKQKFLSSIYNAAHSGVVITQVGKGVYKRAAA